MRGSPAGQGWPAEWARTTPAPHPPTGPATALSVWLKKSAALSRTQKHRNDVEFVTIEAALAWSLEPVVPAGSVVPADRMMVVRGFARYLSGIDPRTEVPPAGTIRHPKHWRRPFIYTDSDVLAMIEQANALIPQPLRSATYQTLIGLLATTGLRVGEALRLDRGDLDRADGVLRIRESKFGKSRLVPLQASAVDALERYDHTRQQLLPNPSTDSLFVSLRGTRVIYECVWPTAPDALQARRGRRQLDRPPSCS